MLRIALIVDKVLRDLGGLVLVAKALARRGAEVYLVPISRNHELFALAPDLVLLHGIRVFHDDLYPKWRDCGLPYAVLDTEGGILPSTKYYETLLTKDQAALQSMKRLYSWGPVLAGYLIEEARLFTPDQIEVTGSPRHDFYVEPWRQAAIQMNDVEQYVSGPLVLINSNFTYANPIDRTQDHAEHETKLFNLADDRLIQAREQGRVALAGLVEAANALAARFPQATIVYRPHPMECLETYQPLLADLPNLKLIRAGSVENWIFRASVVIQRSCSTAVEAAFSSIPALSPRWLPAVEQPVPEAVSIPCQNLDELLEFTRQAIAGELVVPPEIKAVKDRLVADWFYQLDGQAHQRVADSLFDLASRLPRQVNTARCLDYLYGFRGRSRPWPLAKHAQARMQRLFKLSPGWSFTRREDREQRLDGRRFGTPERYFDVKLVQSWIDALQAVDPARDRQPVRVTRVQRDQLLVSMYSYSVKVTAP